MSEVYIITNLITNKSFIGNALTQHKFKSYNDRYRKCVDVSLGQANDKSNLLKNTHRYGMLDSYYENKEVFDEMSPLIH